jgi:hypothetical protein
MRLTLLTLALVLTSCFAEAKLFKNVYVSFELPNDWDCALEGTEWVCRNSKNPQAAREAIIILTAKEAGPVDNLQAYNQHLKTPRTLPTASGAAAQSNILQVKQRMISNHPWVDAMHLGSEIQNYYSRYLATTKDSLGILVTLSAHRLHYKKYANDFFRAVESLKVLSTKGLNTNNPAYGIRPNSGGQLGPGGSYIPPDMIEPDSEPSVGGGSGASDAVLGGGLLLLVAGIYIFLKKRKK